MVHANPIFVLSGYATAQGVEGRKDGATYRLLILIRAADIGLATARATTITLQHGLQFLTIEKSSSLDLTASDAKQDHLKAAIEKVQETGQAIIVYDEQLPPSR